jgi:phage baseplate assembly protein W
MMNGRSVGIPIGLKLPLTSGQVSGYFDQSVDSFTAYQTNIINLIQTLPGERRMNPTFGCRLWTAVFEPNDALLPSKIENIIRDDISAWISDVTVVSVSVAQVEDDKTRNVADSNVLYIVVKCIINVINQEDPVEIILNRGKI